MSSQGTLYGTKLEKVHESYVQALSMWSFSFKYGEQAEYSCICVMPHLPGRVSS